MSKELWRRSSRLTNLYLYVWIFILLNQINNAKTQNKKESDRRLNHNFLILDSPKCINVFSESEKYNQRQTEKTSLDNNSSNSESNASRLNCSFSNDKQNIKQVLSRELCSNKYSRKQKRPVPFFKLALNKDFLPMDVFIKRMDMYRKWFKNNSFVPKNIKFLANAEVPLPPRNTRNYSLSNCLFDSPLRETECLNCGLQNSGYFSKPRDTLFINTSVEMIDLFETTSAISWEKSLVLTSTIAGHFGVRSELNVEGGVMNKHCGNKPNNAYLSSTSKRNSCSDNLFNPVICTTPSKLTKEMAVASPFNSLKINLTMDTLLDVNLKDGFQSDRDSIYKTSEIDGQEIIEKTPSNVADNEGCKGSPKDFYRTINGQYVEYRSPKSINVAYDQASSENIRYSTISPSDYISEEIPHKENSNKRSITLLLVSMFCPQVRNKIKQYIPWMATTTETPPISDLLLPAKDLDQINKGKSQLQKIFAWFT